MNKNKEDDSESMDINRKMGQIKISDQEPNSFKKMLLEKLYLKIYDGTEDCWLVVCPITGQILQGENVNALEQFVTDEMRALYVFNYLSYLPHSYNFCIIDTAVKNSVA